MPGSGYTEDNRSPEYDVLSRRYADLWRGTPSDAGHYLCLRKAYIDWCLALRDDGLKPKEGSAVLLGPGFDVANHDIGPEWVHAHLADHPGLVIADFSREVLMDAFRSLTAASRSMKPERIRLARRDISGGLSVRFEALIGARLDQITTVQEFQDFMKWLENEVGAEEVSRQQVERGATREGSPEVLGVDLEQMLCFRNIVRDMADVRFVMANGVFSGVFYTTESAFRDKLMYFAAQNSQQVTPGHVRMYMRIWHDLITEMIDEVTVNALRSLADAHPDAHVFCTVDMSAQYTGIDHYMRWNLDEVRRRLVDKFSIHVARTWTLDDSLQIPPHQHSVVALWASPVDYGDDDEDGPQTPVPDGEIIS